MPEPLSPSDGIYPDLRPKPPRQGLRAHLLWAAANAFSTLMRLAFHLLYYPLAFTYDAVAWTVSGGEWADWRKSVFPYLLPGRILELAHGTGTLALEMTDRGFTVAAIDLSPAMGKIALRKKRKWEARRAHRGSIRLSDPPAGPVLVRADVRQLPFQKEFFSSAVSTFPAEFIFNPRTLHEVYRTLRPGGRWIILPAAYPEWIASHLLPESKNPSSRDFVSIFARHLEAVGFSVRTEIIRRPHSRVMLILVEKK
ncbi:MAG: class I SAM-dependent methyltransferase [Anaerolineales bacterium]